ncbi:MAG: PilN domain-containing protein [Tepidanaerobacteraceae bacterium]|jgi:hypothetical protein
MHKLNLIPPDLKEKKHEKKYWVFFLCTVCLFLIIIFFSIYIENEVSKIDKEIEQIASEYCTFEESITRKEIKSVDIDVAQEIYDEIINHKIKSSIFLNNVLSVKPVDVSINNIFLNDEGFLTIEGYAPKSSSVANLLNKLYETGAFNDIVLDFISHRQHTYVYTDYAFRVTFQIKRAEQK